MNGRAAQHEMRDGLRLVPGWAIALAICALVVTPLIIGGVAFRREANPPPVLVQMFIGVMAGGIMAFLVLMIGYVSRDSRRRGMNPLLWTLIVIFVPNAIGFIIYFLSRKPLQVPCNQCGHLSSAGFTFCPNCSAALQPSCPQCKKPVQPGFRFCPSCSAPLSQTAPENFVSTQPLANRGA
jgi:hypothetical protein